MKKWLKKLKSINSKEKAISNNLITLGGLETFPRQEKTFVYPEHAPNANCITGECKFCCSPTVKHERFIYCFKIGYPVDDLFNDYGACPSGHWMKSPEHYNKLIIEMNE